MYKIEGEWQDDFNIPIFCEPKTGVSKYDNILLYTKIFTLQYRWGVEINICIKHNLFKKYHITKVY